MGLCKCPKRRVTNQFCYEHRVNVCEYCIVSNHPKTEGCEASIVVFIKCVVQSYLRWLQDSDYSPVCTLCSKDLIIEDCVRLTCYHLFHWACLDQFARELPATTAPAGYTCPTCKACIFPQPNLVSQVADVLKEKLAGVNWARVGLGLPLLSEEIEPGKSVKVNHVESSHINDNLSEASGVGGRGPRDAIVHLEESPVTYSRTTDVLGQQTRRVYKTVDEISSSGFDHDENKYKRKSFLDWFQRWLKNTGGNRRYGSGRRSVKVVVAILLAAFLLVLFMRMGRLTAASDPALDPKSNPYIITND